jgi:hypothetical protein
MGRRVPTSVWRWATTLLYIGPPNRDRKINLRGLGISAMEGVLAGQINPDQQAHDNPEYPKGNL